MRFYKSSYSLRPGSIVLALYAASLQNNQSGVSRNYVGVFRKSCLSHIFHFRYKILPSSIVSLLLIYPIFNVSAFYSVSTYNRRTISSGCYNHVYVGLL